MRVVTLLIGLVLCATGPCAHAAEPRETTDAATEKTRAAEGIRNLGKSPQSDLDILSSLVGTPLSPPDGVPTAGSVSYTASAKNADAKAVVQSVIYTHEVSLGSGYVATVRIRLAIEEPCLDLADVTRALGPDFNRLPHVGSAYRSRSPRETDIWDIGHRLPGGARAIFSFEYRKCAWFLSVFIP